MKVEFLAALAGNNSAARWLSMDDEGSAKVVLETSADQAGQVLRLATMGKRLLKVTVEDAD